MKTKINALMIPKINAEYAKQNRATNQKGRLFESYQCVNDFESATGAVATVANRDSWGWTPCHTDSIKYLKGKFGTVFVVNLYLENLHQTSRKCNPHIRC